MNNLQLTGGVRGIPFIRQFITEFDAGVHFVWGLKPSSYTFRQQAADGRFAVVAMEDGFLRSFRSGQAVTLPLSVTL